MPDLMPNEGASYYTPPVDQAQQVKANEEKAETLKELHIVEATVEWLELQAKEFEKITNLDQASKVSLEAQVHGYQLAAKLFRHKKGELRTYIEAYAPKRK